MGIETKGRGANKKRNSGKTRQENKKSSSMKAMFLIGLAVVLSMSAMVSCSAEVVEKDEKAEPVKTMTVILSSYGSEAQYFGTVESETLKNYSFLMGGRIENIKVSVGMVVKKGTELVSLEPDDFSAAASYAESAYLAAKSAFEYASSNYANIQKLFEEGAVSQNDMDVALQQKNQAESTLSSASANYSTNSNALRNTVLRAEEDGIVTEVSYEKGETAGAGSPVVTVSSGRQKAAVGVSVEDVDKIKQGMHVRVEASKAAEEKAEPVKSEGTVKTVGKLPDMTTRTYPVEIEIPEGQFVLGSFVNVYIPVGDKTGTVIPISAILDDGESYVYLVGNDGKAEKRAVEIKQIADMNAVVTGINEGAQIIVEGMKNIEAGQSVNVK